MRYYMHNLSLRVKRSNLVVINLGWFVVAQFIGLIMFASSSFAARPLTTDDAGVVPVSKYELEIGYDNCMLEDCAYRTHSSSVSVKHGLTEMMDLGVSLPWQIEPSADEKIGAVGLSIKFAIVKDTFAFTLSNSLGTSQYFINSIFSNDFGFINLNLNIGYNATGKYDEKGKLTYSAASIYPLEKFDFMLEVFNDGDNLYWLSGARYSLINGLFVDFGYSRSFQNANEKITGGMHYEF